MKAKRFSVRFNMDSSEERKAWEYIHRNGDKKISKNVIDAITFRRKTDDLSSLIREVMTDVLRENLQGQIISMEENVENDATALEFLSSF